MEMKVGGDGFWVKLKMVVVIWGCWEVGEGLWGDGEGGGGGLGGAGGGGGDGGGGVREWVRELG